MKEYMYSRRGCCKTKINIQYHILIKLAKYKIYSDLVFTIVAAVGAAIKKSNHYSKNKKHYSFCITIESVER